MSYSDNIQLTNKIPERILGILTKHLSHESHNMPHISDQIARVWLIGSSAGFCEELV